MRIATKLTDDDIIDAVDELEAQGLVGRSKTLSDDPIGFTILYPEASLFAGFDQHFKDWNPAVDAGCIAAELLNGDGNAEVPHLAEQYGWPPRRINPAIEYLFERRLVESSRLMGKSPWSLLFVRKNPATRRFARDQ